MIRTQSTYISPTQVNAALNADDDPETLWSYPINDENNDYNFYRVRRSDGASDFYPSDIVSAKIAGTLMLGIDSITGSFPDLEPFAPVCWMSPYILQFNALDEDGTERRYFSRADLAQVLALEATTGPIEYVDALGESTEAGGGPNGSPLNLTTPPETHRCIMFAGSDGGTMSSPNLGVFYASSVTDFTPACESGTDGRAETQLTGNITWRDAKIVANNRRRRTFLAAGHAKRGATMAQIAKGTQPYTNGITRLTRAAELAWSLYRRDIIVRGISCSSGVNDRADGTTRTAMRDAWVQHCVDINTDYKAITGQTDDIYLLCKQVRAPESGTCSPDMALALLDASRLDSRIRIVGPEYHLIGDYGLADSVHSTSLGYDVLGEMTGKVAYDMFDAAVPVDWKPLQPKPNSEVPFVVEPTGGLSFTVEFDVPVAPLVIDTSWLPDFNQNGYYNGFKYTSDTGANITGISVVDDVKLEFTVDADIRAHTNRVLHYADSDTASNTTGKSKVWGNLRDSETRESIVEPGLDLVNACVIFAEPF